MTDVVRQVAIVGPGAVGGTLAARLYGRTRHHVTLCARRSFQSLELEAPEGRTVSRVSPLLDPGAALPTEWVFLAVKAHQTESAAPWLRSLVHSGTRVAILQNGVEHVERVAPYTADAALVPVVVSCPAESPSPGRVVLRGEVRLIVAEGPEAEELELLLRDTGIQVKQVTDFKSAAWQKLVSNAAAGAVTAMTGSPMGVLHRPDAADVAKALIDECMAVGRAEGASFPPNFVEELWEQWRQAPADRPTSILIDRRLGRPLEYEARNEVVVRLGERHGISTPVSRAVTALLKAVSDAGRTEGSRDDGT
jgi:2-dehydropantoate 2-reductase